MVYFEVQRNGTHISIEHIFFNQPRMTSSRGKPDTLLGLFIYLSSRHNIKY